MATGTDAKAINELGRRVAASRLHPDGRWARRRREILGVGAELFRQRGYEGTTFGDIATALGIDRPSMYYYVSGKEEILEELVGDAVRSNLAAAEAIRDGEGSAPEKLRRLIEETMDSYARYFPTPYVLIQENLSRVRPERRSWASEMREINRAYEAVVIEIVEAGRADGTITEGPPAWLVSYGVLGMVGWTHRWFNPGGAPFAADEIGAAFADLLLGGLHQQA